MTRRKKELADRLEVFHNDVISFVEKCSEKDWRKVCPDEEWTVGVVARHIAAGHYGALALAQMIVTGDPLPDLTIEAVNRINAQHAEEHADCARSEVLDILLKKGRAIADYVAGLSDADLDRTAHLALLGGDISTQKLIEIIIVQSGSAHLASMKKALEPKP